MGVSPNENWLPTPDSSPWEDTTTAMDEPSYPPMCAIEPEVDAFGEEREAEVAEEAPELPVEEEPTAFHNDLADFEDSAREVRSLFVCL